MILIQIDLCLGNVGQNGRFLDSRYIEDRFARAQQIINIVCIGWIGTV